MTTNGRTAPVAPGEPAPDFNVEWAREGLEGIDRLPSDEEVLAAARAL